MEKYNIYKLNIAIIENDINELYNKHIPNGIQIISGMPHGSGTSNQTCDTALKIEEEKTKFEIDLKKYKHKVNIIDSFIGTLKHKDRQLLIKKIKENKQWLEIAFELNYENIGSAKNRYGTLTKKYKKVTKL
jgi:hypothetical protein